MSPNRFTSNTYAWNVNTRKKAIEFASGVSPYVSIAPVIELVRAADALGFDVIRGVPGTQEVTMKVSVIIPTYNMGKYIEECLASVFAQTERGAEIIVIDDGSTDDTANRMQRYPGVHYILQQNCGKPGAVRNLGLRHARGQFIAFLDADDKMLPDRLEKQATFLEMYPSVGLVFCNYRNFNDAGDPYGVHFDHCPELQKHIVDGKAVLGSRLATTLLPLENIGLPSSMMIRREALNFMPQFTTAVRIGEDFHFTYSIARYWQIGAITYPGCLRRLHGSNISKESIATLQDKITAREMLLADEEYPPARASLHRFIRAAEVSLARELANHRRIIESVKHAAKARSLVAMLRTMLIAVGMKKAIPGT